MEAWELDYEWLKVRHLVKRIFKRDTLPDLNAILFLIGIQELGRWQSVFTKEEKQDLLHIAVCRLLSYPGYYEFVGRDADGWPHWQLIKPVPGQGLKEQADLLRENVILYFKDMEKENGGWEEE